MQLRGRCYPCIGILFFTLLILLLCPPINAAPRPDWNNVYYHRADLVLFLNREIRADLVADMIAGYLGV